ncbi:ADOP family protein [Occallatibacter riparius]|uniref:Uncharacterized protein n=1 Tax=Occallatibacter riparius TaxID=1002689 RepID=A0A9J7BVD4_9BACT|nr:hypothetical protein [Occallatibacter riparius]UWZ84862.1 hypothetical protein MOP44_02730 [Occallatibacter riparius]
MIPAASFAFHAMHVALLRGASMMVPFPQRDEWYREWTSELWHVRRDCVPVGAFSWTAEREVTAFCIGSFQDAACLRGQRGTVPVASASMHGSARYCVLLLCAVLAVCVIIGRFLPGIESEKEAAQSALPQGVILIEAGQYGDGERATIPFDEYRKWATRRQRYFEDMAFYRMAKERVQAGGLDAGQWVVAHATENLAGLVGAGVADTGADVPRVMLGRSMWRRVFQSDPSVIGQAITVAHHKVRIAGIAPAGVWQLPGHADLWVMESGAAMALTPHAAKGHVIALLSPLGRAEMSGAAVGITAYSEDGEAIDHHGMRLAPSTGGPVSLYLFALLLAVLALPAIVSVFQTESSFDSHKPSVAARVKRAAFLVTKMGLVAALGYFAALDIAYCSFPEYAGAAEFLQFASSFTICLFGLRWALMDQSRRCPVCLRCVTHPAQVGIASCTFLGWNGTEMMCTGGHVLLHVPSLPTSWFSRQRWMYLDTSWDFLFADRPGQI